MARFEATTAIVALLAGAGALAAGSCEEPESVQHNGSKSFLGGSGGLGTLGGPGGAGGGAGTGEGSIAGGTAGLTGAAGADMAAPGGGPGDTGGSTGEAGGGTSGSSSGEGGIAAEGGHPAASAGAGGGALIGTAGAGGFAGGRAMGAGGGTSAGGRGGTSSGAGGSAGTAGLGGAGGATPPCGTCTLFIQCRNNAPTDMTSMNAEVWISNISGQAIPLSMIKVRYYYTNEGGPMTLEIFDKAFKRTDGTGYQTVPASFSMTSGKLAKPPMDFSDVAINGTSTIDGTVPFYFKMAIHDLNHTKLTLTNDYSNLPVAIGPCPTLVALVNNGVAAGVPPR